MAGNSNSGRYRQRRLGERSPDALSELPPAPAWLLPEGREPWKRIGGLLVKRGSLTDGNLSGLAAMISAELQIAVLHRRLLDDPGDRLVRLAMAAAQATLRTWCLAFLLVPSADPSLVESEPDRALEF